MAEKERLLDGTPNPNPGQNMNECARSEIEYGVAQGDQRPTVRYVSGDDLLEIRDYKKTVVLDSRVTFDLIEVITTPFQVTSESGRVHTVYSRVGVLARIDGLPAIIVYYDSFSPDVRVTSDIAP